MTTQEYLELQDRIQLDCKRVAAEYARKREKKSKEVEIKKIKAQLEALEAEGNQ